MPSSSSSSCHPRSDSRSDGPHHQARAKEQPRATHTCERGGYIGICFGDTHFKHICKLFPVNRTKEALSTTKEHGELTAACARAKKPDETKELPTAAGSCSRGTASSEAHAAQGVHRTLHLPCFFFSARTVKPALF